MMQERAWLVPFLRQLSVRPRQVLGREDVRALAVFLDAYGSIRRDAGLPEFPLAEGQLLEAFHRWLAGRYGLFGLDLWQIVERLDASPSNVWTFLDCFDEYLRVERGVPGIRTRASPYASLV